MHTHQRFRSNKDQLNILSTILPDLYARSTSNIYKILEIHYLEYYIKWEAHARVIVVV